MPARRGPPRAPRRPNNPNRGAQTRLKKIKREATVRASGSFLFVRRRRARIPSFVGEIIRADARPRIPGRRHRRCHLLHWHGHRRRVRKQILGRLGPTAFARLEFIIGALGLIAPLLILKLGTNRLAIVSILPSTIAMGATLPAMAKLSRIPAAYAANTAGAVIGCLATAFLLMPKLGLVAPAVIWAACNFAAAFLASRFPSQSSPKSGSTILPTLLAATLFTTGFLALAFETIGVRLLSFLWRTRYLRSQPFWPFIYWARRLAQPRSANAQICWSCCGSRDQYFDLAIFIFIIVLRNVPEIVR